MMSFTVFSAFGDESTVDFFILGFNDTTYDTLPLTLVSGRLPLNGGEVLIPNHIQSNAGVTYNIGDTITLEVGNREANGLIRTHNNPFRVDEHGLEAEILVSKTTQEYTVVGITERPRFEHTNAPGYTVITMMDIQAADASAQYDLYTALKQPRKVYNFAENAADGNDYTFNAGLLRFLGVSQNDFFNTMLYSLGGILIAMIMFGSVLLIYNSFAISVSERTRQFGILSSVGATKKQLRNSVLFEGICIGVIGIPLGLAAGVVGIGVTLQFVGDMFGDNLAGIPLTLSLSVPALTIAAAVSVVTILLSAYIPAVRAVKKSAIDTIRQADDVKITASGIKTSRLTQLLFGLEGALALKNYKRNKRRYRSTVISLFVSIVLFISASAFGMYLKLSVERTLVDYGYDITFYHTDRRTFFMPDEEILRLYESLKTVSGVYGSAYQNMLLCSGYVDSNEISARYYDFWYGETDGNNVYQRVEVAENSTVFMRMSIQFLDDATYFAYLTELNLSTADYGVEKGRLPAVAVAAGYDSSRQRSIYIEIFKNNTVSMSVTPGLNEEDWNKPPKDITFTLVDSKRQTRERT
jgi:putative ABC transport system permease protein